MKITDARPCDSCDGPLLGPTAGMVPGMRANTFHVLRHSQAMLNPIAAREVMGMAAYFGGAMGLAELFSPSPQDAITICGDVEPVLMRELFLCERCAYGKPLDLASLLERRSAALERQEDEVPV